MKLLALALCASFLCLGQDAKVTIEQLMSAPFPTDVTASPAGGHFAWVQNASGVRNVFMAAAPDYQAKPVTAYKSDDGQEISQLVWLPSAESILFVRGGSANAKGENPNPLSDPAGAEQAIYLVPAGGGEPKRLAEGSAPTPSPKGDAVAYLLKGQVWTVRASADAKPEQLFKARGSQRSLAWAPDGNRLAFVSVRGDHSFVGVFDVAARKITWVDPALEWDEHPVWSTDGTKLAFVRTPYTKRFTLFGSKREAAPWSLRVADAATGTGRAIFTAEAGRGSVFHGITAANQIFWAAGDFVVFPWERDGWTHLYSIAAAGGPPKRLTYGSCEVEHVSLGVDGKDLVFSSNCDDLDRRHVYRVAAAGGPLAPLSSGKGIEWSPVVSSDGKALMFLRSEAKAPARAAVQTSFGQPRDLLPPEFPAGPSLVEPVPVSITAADGMRIPAQLFLPAGASATDRRPAVVFFHGGSRRQMLLGWHYLSYYHNAYAFNQYLVSKGYVVLSVNYRSGTGYGLEFREAINYGATGASEFQDVIGAGLFLQARPEVDPARIGLWGGSYGGYLTALGLARASSLFSAGVDVHGVHDWNVELKHWNPAYETSQQEGEAKVAFESSPMASMKTWKSPVLLVHGDDDRNVPFIESVMLTEALREQGIEFEQLALPDEIHGFLRHESWLRVFRSAADFLDRRLARKR